jgi:N-methylhydantoinase A
MSSLQPEPTSTSPGTTALQIAVDIGGTFTDGVAWRESDGEIVVAKALTTPDDPGLAVSTVTDALLAQLGADSSAGDVHRVIHGTTLVTNTLVERRGARAALILTHGTEDCLDIRRELRYDTYDLHAEYPQALVTPNDRYGLSARHGPDGSVWRPLLDDEVDDIVARIGASDCQAVAICLLHAAANGEHEAFVADKLKRALPNLSVCSSFEVAREIGEYERMSTVAANAYVQPVVSQYLRELRGRLKALGIPGALHVMLSNGAFTTADLAASAPIRILESGPAGGVQSAVNCAQSTGFSKVLAFDMGGTTAKACVAVDGRPSLTHVFEFGRVKRFKRGSGLPAVAPSIDLIEIGAGGGSLARVNELGLLQVGPQSAGAEPGPACYGQGGEAATVTDADLLLGYLDPEAFLGGQMRLDVAAARAALERTGAPLGLDAERTALGIHNIVNENMAAAARTHIAEQGLDARAFTMVATGGAGPVHAVDVARRLRISRILCPIASGVGSCLGFLAAPARADRSWSRVETVASLDEAQFHLQYRIAREGAQADLTDCGVSMDDVKWLFAADVRYVGQGHTVEVPIADPGLNALPPQGKVLEAFEREYQRLYHKTVPDGIAEVVTWRLSGASPDTLRNFRLARDASAPLSAPVQTRRVHRCDREVYEDVPVRPRHSLPPGSEVAGPIIITEPESTLVVACAARVSVHKNGTIEVNLEEVT